MFRFSRTIPPAAAALLLAASLANASSGNFQGYSWSSFGAATVTQYANDSLRIGNIGSSGNDGVAISIPTSMRGDFLVGMAQLPLSATPVGAYMITTFTGTVNGVPNQQVGVRRAVVTSDPNYPVSVREDYSAIGANEINTQIVAHRNVVADHTTAPGDTALATSIIKYRGWPNSVSAVYVDGVRMGDDLSDGDGWPITPWWALSFTLASNVVSQPRSTGSLSAVSNYSGVSFRGSNVTGGFTITSLSAGSDPLALPSASLPLLAFGAAMLLFGGTVALRRKTMLA